MTRLARTTRRRLARLAATALLLTSPVLHAAPVQWTAAAGGNDHWYEYVSTGNIFAPIGFDAARGAAWASSHMGQGGYLATITSAEEQTFIQSSFSFLLGFGNSGTAWLGASDAAVEGEWRWLDGPEAGQLLGYTNWLPGHPANGPGQEQYDLLAFSISNNVVGQAPVYGWTSVPMNGGAFGYIVEYGTASADPDPDPNDPNPVPEPSGALMAATALLLAGVQRRRRRG